MGCGTHGLPERAQTLTIRSEVLEIPEEPGMLATVTPLITLYLLQYLLLNFQSLCSNTLLLRLVFDYAGELSRLNPLHAPW